MLDGLRAVCAATCRKTRRAAWTNPDCRLKSINASPRMYVCTTNDSAQGVVSEELRDAIKREVRSELYEKMAEQNKALGGKVRTGVWTCVLRVCVLCW